MHVPFLSVVIRTKNREHVIEETLSQVFDQDYPAFEVLMIDSGSTDSTLSIARQFPVRIWEIEAKEFSFGKSLNFGFEKSRGDLVISLSSHCIPAHPSWLMALTQPLRDHPRCGASYGRKLSPQEADPYYIAVNAHNPFNSPCDRVEPPLRPLFSNSNACIRKALWREFPFDEYIHAEDAVWASKIRAQNWEIHYKADAGVYHTQYHREGFRQIFDREYAVVRVLLSTTGDKRHIDTNTSLWNIITHLILRIPRTVLNTFLKHRINPAWFPRAFVYQYAWYLGPLKAVLELKKQRALE